MNHPTLTYSIELPKDVEQILEVDFWVYTHLTAQLLQPVTEAVKFTSPVSVFIEKGTVEAEVNLLNIKAVAPCIVHIKPGDVVQLHRVSEDFDALFLVMSIKVRDLLLLSLHDAGASPAARLDPVVNVPAALVPTFCNFYASLEKLNADEDHPYRLQAFHHAILAFYFYTAHECYDYRTGEVPRPAHFRRNPLVDRFLVLVQKSFKEERQIEFYASQLGVTPKHLSRILKQTTGFTAADWIKNYILLEAKVMLKSSTLTMGQISTQLNFPSQSFFAKFFKNATGLTPKQYRNTPI